MNVQKFHLVEISCLVIRKSSIINKIEKKSTFALDPLTGRRMKVLNPPCMRNRRVLRVMYDNLQVRKPGEGTRYKRKRLLRDTMRY